MAADEVLAAEAVEAGRPLVRLYGWSEPTVSLGGFQRLADARACEALSALPLVRRPSGGGAILHGSDLTYASPCPASIPGERPAGALRRLPRRPWSRNAPQRGIDRAPTSRPRPHQAATSDRLLCFDRRARGRCRDRGGGTSADGHKILGSAQRRLQAARAPARQPPAPLTGGRCAVPSATPASPNSTNLPSLATPGTPAGLAGRVADATGGTLEIAAEPFATARDRDDPCRGARFLDPAWLGRR